MAELSPHQKYYERLKKVYKKPEDYELAGKGNGYIRIDAEAKATGTAVYFDDIFLPGMLYAKYKRSPYARAKILSIDTSKAEAYPGVKCVITGKDFNGPRIGDGEAFKEMADRDVLNKEEVRYIGDEVAVVCAVDEETAKEALDLIDVKYEPLPFVLDPLESLKDDAPPVHEPGKHNISILTTMAGGDVDKAFAEADYKDEVYYKTQMMVHAALEPHGAVAKYENNEWTVWTTTQSTYHNRFWVARALQVPESRVRLIKAYTGGGFGGKVDVFGYAVVVAYLAKKTGHPVKITYERDEVFYGTTVRHPMVMKIESAFKKDGTLLAKRCEHILDGGAYGVSGTAANALSLIWANFPYKIPAIDMIAKRPYTNKPAAGAMRGYTACQVHFAHDLHMEEVAEKLGIDSLELRKHNGMTEGYEGITGFKVTSCAFRETLDAAAEAIHWKERKHGLPRGEGIGIAGSAFVSGTGFPRMVSPAYASNSTVVRLNREGYATCFTGVNDIGQGCDTVMAMIVAEELGLGMDDVKLIQSDTTLTPWDSGSYGSRVTFLAGNACRRAVASAKYQLFEVLAAEWGCNVEDLNMKDHRVFHRKDPEKNVSYNEAVFKYEEKNFGQSCVGVGSYAHEGDKRCYYDNIGNYAPSYSFSSSAAKVKVDEETGCIDVSDFIFAHDCGRPLNTRAVEGQIEGSVLLGLAFAAYEECVFDKNGKMLNPSFRDYRFPTALDMPRIQTILCGKPDADGPFGAKEAGEGSTAPVAPAIVNAINSALGVKFHELPVTPERIWRAIKERDATAKKTQKQA